MTSGTDMPRATSRRLTNSELAARGEPVAYVVRALSDGSICSEIAPVNYLMHDYDLEKLKNDPWVVNGKAEIVPLYLSAVSETEEKRYGFEKAHAVCILLCRDALLRKDYEGAYHWLYTLDSKQVPHDPFNPWLELEALAGEDYKPETVTPVFATRENEGFYEKAWKDFCSLQCGSVKLIAEEALRYRRLKDASGRTWDKLAGANLTGQLDKAIDGLGDDE